MKTLSAFFLMIFVLISFSACDKDNEEGLQGPAGAEGEQGAIGVQGNANVHFKIDTIQTSDWSSNPLYFTIASTLTDSAITQSIVDSGVVMVYAKNAGWWLALPYSAGLTEWRFQWSLNTIMIIATVSAGPTPVIPTTSTIVKIVTIESSGRKAHPNVNWNNYEEVKAEFKLPD